MEMRTQRIKSLFSSTSNISWITIASGRARPVFWFCSVWFCGGRLSAACWDLSELHGRKVPTDSSWRAEAAKSFLVFVLFCFLRCEATDWKSKRRVTGAPAVRCASWFVCASIHEFQQERLLFLFWVSSMEKTFFTPALGIFLVLFHCLCFKVQCLKSLRKLTCVSGALP